MQDRRTVLKGIGIGIATVSAGSGIAAGRGHSGNAGQRMGASAEDNIVETAIALNSSGPFAGTFDTLIAAVTEAGLIDTLSGSRQFTVFAPTDDAFDEVLGIGPGDVAGVDDETLLNILLYHVTPGRRYAESVVNASMLPTVNGARIDVEDELAGNIVATDVEASNGVIHAIDTVLLP
jgi:uncharacterized surface protein with fasciclin (FAS1) repeats